MQGDGQTVLERFKGLSTEQFATEVAELWEATGRIVEAVANEVTTNGVLSPVTGLGIISCVTGQVFAYQQFHGEPPTAELMSQLMGRQGVQRT